MKRIFLLLLISLFATLTVYGKKSPMVADSTNSTKSLQAKWTLDKVILYQYSDNDSVEISNSLLADLPEKPFMLGIFDTLYFEEDMCTVSAKDMRWPFQAYYQRKGNILELMGGNVVYNYIIINDKNPLELYYKYSHIDRSNNNTVLYGIKLIYTK
jgi:hypothetical protein